MRFMFAWLVDPVVRDALRGLRELRADRDAWQADAMEWRRVAAIHEQKAKAYHAFLLSGHPSRGAVHADWERWEKELDHG